MSQVFAIIPAAGAGLRFGGDVRKQYLQLKGKTLLERTLDTFLKANIFDRIIVCVPADEIQTSSNPKITYVVGGNSRGESVQKGFQFLNPADDDVVLVHDAVRPLVTVDLIRRVALATQKSGTVIPVLPLTDTIKEIENGRALKTIDRTRLASVQTPQGFPCGLLRNVYKKLGPPDQRFTDEAMLIEHCNEPVHTVEGDRRNIKVTTPFDMELAEFFLKDE